MDKRTKRINNPNFEVCLNSDNNWEKLKGDPCESHCPAFVLCKKGKTLEVEKDADDYIEEITSLKKELRMQKQINNLIEKDTKKNNKGVCNMLEAKDKKQLDNALEWRDFFKDCGVHQNVGVDRKRLVLTKLDKLEEWKKTLMSEHRSDASLIKTLQKRVKRLERNESKQNRKK